MQQLQEMRMALQREQQRHHKEMMLLRQDKGSGNSPILFSYPGGSQYPAVGAPYPGSGYAGAPAYPGGAAPAYPGVGPSPAYPGFGPSAAYPGGATPAYPVSSEPQHHVVICNT